MAELAAPQMVVNSRMLYTSWMPADPEAAAALLPAGGPRPAGPVYMNQYVVDREEQTSGFGAYSLTYLGLDIAGMMDPHGVIPARYILFYFNSSEVMREYTTREYDLPAVPGATSVEVGDGRVVATTSLDGTPVIRTEAGIGPGILMTFRGQLTYVRQMAGRFMAGNSRSSPTWPRVSRSARSSSSTRATPSMPSGRPTRSRWWWRGRSTRRTTRSCTPAACTR